MKFVHLIHFTSPFSLPIFSLFISCMRTIFMIIHALTCNNNKIVSEMKETEERKEIHERHILFPVTFTL